MELETIIDPIYAFIDVNIRYVFLVGLKNDLLVGTENFKSVTTCVIIICRDIFH